MAELQFNAQNYTPATPGVSQLPISDDMGHPVMIIKSEIVQTKDRESGVLNLTFQITEGAHAGASGLYRLNIYNKSEAASNIAMSQLSAICYVTGIFQITDTSQLHGIPFRALVRQQTDDNRYTEVYGVLDIAGNLPGQQGATPAADTPTPATPQAPAPGPAAQPWKSPAAVPGVPVPGQPAVPAVPVQNPQAPAGGAAAPPWGSRVKQSLTM